MFGIEKNNGVNTILVLLLSCLNMGTAAVDYIKFEVLLENLTWSSFQLVIYQNIPRLLYNHHKH